MKIHVRIVLIHLVRGAFSDDLRKSSKNTKQILIRTFFTFSHKREQHDKSIKLQQRKHLLCIFLFQHIHSKDLPTPFKDFGG